MADDDADDLLLQVEEVVADGTEFIEFESGGQEVDHAYCYSFLPIRPIHVLSRL